VPLMIANMISFLISKHYQPMPLYHALLQQDHVHLPAPGVRMPVGTRRARDIMTREFTFIPPDISIEKAARVAAPTGAGCFLASKNKWSVFGPCYTGSNRGSAWIGRGRSPHRYDRHQRPCACPSGPVARAI